MLSRKQHSLSLKRIFRRGPLLFSDLYYYIISIVVIRTIIIVNIIIILLIPFIHLTVFFISMLSIAISNLPFVNSRISWKSPVQENTWKHAVFWKYAMFMKIPEVQENARCSWKCAIWDVHVNLRCSNVRTFERSNVQENVIYV